MKNIKQKTIGLNPLEEYLSSTKESSIEQSSLPENQYYVTETHIPVKKQRVTIHVPIDLIERVKNAVYWEPGLTLAGFAEDALFKALEALEQQKGSPYPNRRDRQLRGGRPIK